GTSPPAARSGIGGAVRDGCWTPAATNGREWQGVILTMHASEAPVLASVAESVNVQKSALKAVGSAGRNDGVRVVRGATGARLAFGSRPVVELFRQFAILDEGSERKRFTPAVFELDRPALSALLRGL